MSSSVTESTNEAQNASNPPEVPDLDQIISQITANGEFQDMMNSLSDGLKKVEENQATASAVAQTESDTRDTDANLSVTDTGGTVTTSVNCDTTSTYDICATFLADQEGNNLCDVVRGVQLSLDGINQNLSKLVSLVETHTSK